MRITREQQLELQEIIKQTSVPIEAFEVTGNDAEKLKFKFKTNFFSFEVEKRSHQEYISNVFPVYDKNGFNTPGTWENTKGRFNRWAKEIERDILIQLDWETEKEIFISSEGLNPEVPIQERVKNAVVDGNLDLALDLLEHYFEKNKPEKDLIFSVILRKSELQEINKMELKGLFTREEAGMKRTNLKKTILEIASYA